MTSYSVDTDYHIGARGCASVRSDRVAGEISRRPGGGSSETDTMGIAPLRLPERLFDTQQPESEGAHRNPCSKMPQKWIVGEASGAKILQGNRDGPGRGFQAQTRPPRGPTKFRKSETQSFNEPLSSIVVVPDLIWAP